jgi:hypothetical protein
MDVLLAWLPLLTALVFVAAVALRSLLLRRRTAVAATCLRPKVEVFHESWISGGVSLRRWARHCLWISVGPHDVRIGLHAPFSLLRPSVLGDHSPCALIIAHRNIVSVGLLDGLLGNSVELTYLDAEARQTRVRLRPRHPADFLRALDTARSPGP